MFRPVLLVFFRLLKCYQNGGSFCCDVQLCNRTRHIVIITRRANDVKMRGKINAGLSSNFLSFFIIYRPLQFLSRSKKETVDRKTKRIMCSVHYKKTHTNINVKKRSNHPESMKRAIIKGFADRARALCDEKHLAEELHNIEDVFVVNGYPRETVRRFMEQRPQQIDKREQEEPESHYKRREWREI